MLKQNFHLIKICKLALNFNKPPLHARVKNSKPNYIFPEDFPTFIKGSVCLTFQEKINSFTRILRRLYTRKMVIKQCLNMFSSKFQYYLFHIKREIKLRATLNKHQSYILRVQWWKVDDFHTDRCEKTLETF